MRNQNELNKVSRNLIFGTSSSTKGAFYGDMRLQKSIDPNANRAGIILALKKTSWFEKLWYPFFILAGLSCLIFVRPITFELIFAVFSLILYMFAENLFAQGKIIGLILSTLSAVLYTTVCFFAKVYGEIIINILLYIPMDILAIITFKKSKNKKTDDLSVRKSNWKNWLAFIGAAIIGFLCIFSFLHFVTQQEFAYFNALTITLFITSICIRNLRFIDFWWFDLLGNIISVLMWVFISTSSGELLYSLPFTLSSMAALLNNIYGIIMWRKLFKVSSMNGGVYVKKTVKVKHVIKLRRRYNKAMKWNRQVENKRKNEVLSQLNGSDKFKDESYLSNLRNTQQK